MFGEKASRHFSPTISQSLRGNSFSLSGTHRTSDSQKVEADMRGLHQFYQPLLFNPSGPYSWKNACPSLAKKFGESLWASCCIKFNCFIKFRFTVISAFGSHYFIGWSRNSVQGVILCRNSLFRRDDPSSNSKGTVLRFTVKAGAPLQCLADFVELPSLNLRINCIRIPSHISDVMQKYDEDALLKPSRRGWEWSIMVSTEPKWKKWMQRQLTSCY